ncbi:MAG: radical SAM protein [Armatimonadota bacterium]|nr:radical SAM protein [Armatimonadota bacterium]
MSAKSIVLVNSNRWKPGAPPVALDYLASACVDKGIEAEILDLCYSKNTAQDIRAFFKGRKPDLIGITIRNLDDVYYSCFLLAGVKVIIDQIKQASDAPIVLGGSGFSIAPAQVLEYCGVDLGIAGEGEEALPMLVENLGDTEAYSSIPGLVYRLEGNLVQNPLGMMDLSKLNLSRRGYVDHSPYLIDPKSKTKTGAVQTKRGCSQSCIYCVVPAIEGGCVRLRPIKHIVDEIENLAALGVYSFWFADSEFNYPEKHAKDICREIIARGLPEVISWNAYIAPKPFSKELAELMKEAGCKSAVNCIDHGSDVMLERLGKDFRVQDIKDAIVVAREAGLNTNYCLMLGGPGDTIDAMLKSLELLLSMRPIKVTLGEIPGVRVYPNSPLADIVKDEGFSPKNRNLSGTIRDNDGLLKPVYYLSKYLSIFVPVVKAWRSFGSLRHRSKSGGR